MVRKRTGLLFLTALLFIPAMGSFAEGDLSMELGINNIILQTRETVEDTVGNPYWGWMTTGSAGFSFKSVGTRNVKADLAFSFVYPEMDLSILAGAEAGSLMMPIISLDRAYLKARFPQFRITAGKTRLGWGDGFVFNSGDIIFGSTDTSVDLTASVVRTETEWLTAVNIPFGKFSFVEGIIIPPGPLSSGGPGKINETSGGGRLYTKLAGIKIEAGYFFDQTERNDSGTVESVHKPYVALQGNLLADWYVSSSAALPVAGDLITTVEDSLNISGGLFYLLSLNSISSLTFRLEGLYRPFHSWTEKAHLPGEEAPTYALLLYPEISWTPIDTVSLSARVLWSPVDTSAMITAGAGWNVFEGFDLSLYGLFHAGDADDSFSWNRDSELWIPGADIVDGMAMILGINYIY